MKAQDVIGLIKYPSKQDRDLVLKAFNFAEFAHQDQERFSGEPYFVHVYETAKTLADLGMGSITVSAGLLHDCLEDGRAKEEEIEEIFGKEILFLVKGTTKLGKIKYRGVQRHNESLRKLFVAVSQDIRVIIIKLADRLHNMKTLDHVPAHKRQRIAVETLEIYAPIAYRLGIRRLNRELEDLAFPFVYPEEYKKTKEAKARAKEDQIRLEKFQRAVKKTLAKKGVTNFNVDYRLKTLYSLFRKLERKDWNIDKIYDISALRIIVPNVQDCYGTLGIVHGIWRPLPGRIKDYIAFPKPNGYRALHTTIFTGYGNVIEIQIKTKEMHQEAEYGIASHVSYKESSRKDRVSNFLWIKRLLPFKNSFGEGKKDEFDMKDVPRWIKELVEYQETIGRDPSAKDEMKTDFFQQRIFVFTPKGDVVDLPIDSSPIDFAYAIHSDIGNKIAGVKVNGKMTSLDSFLSNGDIVEILTKKSGSPRRKWLEYVKTATARKQIKMALQKPQEVR